ncbi:MAG: hypothetical protein ACPHL7_08625, partial [Flavobacteriaceae bacterium]
MQELKSANEFERAVQLYQNSRFFRTLIANSMMSMTKSFFQLVGFDSNSNIRIIKLKGKIDSVVLNNNSDLEEAHTTAEVSGQIQITNNSSLVAVNTKDSKASGVKISGNSDLESVNIETQTIDTTEDADTKVDGTYEVTNNASLLKTTISSNKIHSLTITGNDDMTEIDLTGMSTLGDTTTGRYMGIYANDLTATRATD